MDYLSPLSNALCYILGVEQLLGITDDIPERAQQARVLLCELHRIASHCVWLGTGGIDLGAISGFFYAFDLRERILDLTEALGRRADASELPAHRRPARRLPRRLPRQARRADRDVLRAHARPARALAEEPDPARPHDRRRHPQRRGCARVGHHRPVAARDRRRLRRAPRVPVQRLRGLRVRRLTRTEGDAYARFMVRLDEMDQSMRIIEQARKQLERRAR